MGAIVLALLTNGCALLYIVSVRAIHGGLVGLTFDGNVSGLEALVLPACVGAVLGVLSRTLWCDRSLTVRAICAGVGVAATAIGFGLLWMRLLTPNPEPNILGFHYLHLKQQFLLLCAQMAPTLLWAWTLLFAAPFVRSSPRNPKVELGVWMSAGAVAGSVGLVVVTLIGANIYLLHFGQSRAWIGNLVALFWVQMPFTGAVFGVLFAALWKGRRGYVVRGASVVISLGTAWLTWGWAKGHLSGWLQGPPALVALIAAPTMLWALALLFFALVSRTRRDLNQTQNFD